MATTTAPATTTSTTRPLAGVTRTLPRATVASGLVAAAATTAVAAATHAAGVSLEIEGEMIPLLGFAQMTMLGAVIGGAILAGLNRFSGEARAWFLRTAVVLTAASCIPSVVWPDDAATIVTLVVTHVLAAAIVVPALARHARS
jgi:hypothetical protein